MQRPCLFNTDSVGILSYSESLSCSAALSLQNSTLEYLDSLTVSFLDLTIYLYGVSYMNIRVNKEVTQYERYY